MKFLIVYVYASKITHAAKSFFTHLHNYTIQFGGNLTFGTKQSI